ncbi:hypothetical protein D9619_012658 [Psilocybe cf. subviscida]|uniref:Uncharacterized protein n=1 Tax=Psilocybe cf. subviscida TaxID=2480587 RepID=A0A8H5B6M3_9AGAR|nr:hypothetical protein D9619_012658 [Psilocybe cf. subviscida]
MFLEMAQPMALELYHAIIQHVDNTDDLLSLALCCSAFGDEAQRCLLRHVEPKSKHQLTRLISAINASPLRLGPLIHTFCLRERTASGEEDPAAPLSISMALRSMCNLEHLINDRPLPSTVLQGCTFKLRTLVWTCFLQKPSLLFLFCNFLPTQPSIKHLHLYQSEPFDLAEVPTNLCPMLDSFKASDYNIISCLLRDDRLITRFQWRMMEGLPKMTNRQVNHLKYLQCMMNKLDMDDSFTLQMTSLVFLELHLKHFRSTEVRRLIQMLQFLQHIPRLEVLVMQNNSSKHRNFVPAYQHAFELCPTLKYIDARYYLDEFYDRFFPPGDGDSDSENGALVTRRRVHEREVLGWRCTYGVGPAWSNYV